MNVKRISFTIKVVLGILGLFMLVFLVLPHVYEPEDPDNADEIRLVYPGYLIPMETNLYEIGVIRTNTQVKETR